MIEKLTQEQIDRQEEVKNYWINLALYSGDEIDEIEAKNGIDWLYEKANLPKVDMLIVDSPLGIQYAFNLLKELDIKKLKNSVVNSVWNSVRNSVENSVVNSVRNSVGNSVWNSVGNSVWNSVRNSVRNSVENSVVNSVRNSVGNSVVNSVWDSVVNSVRNSVLKYYEYNWQNLTNIGWFSFYDYWYDFDLYDEETKNNFQIYKRFLQSGIFFTSCYSDIAIVSRRPKVVRKNDTEQLHSDQLPAIEWRDGYKLFFLDGVEFTEELWNKVISQKMTFKEIMAIDISDQRTVALKYNPLAILNEGATLVHKDDRSNELYCIEGKEINKELEEKKIWFLKMKCPTGRIFIEGVPPDEAEKNPNSTDMQALLCGLTKSQYASLLLES